MPLSAARSVPITVSDLFVWESDLSRIPTLRREWPVRPGALVLGVQAAPATAGDRISLPAPPKVLHISNCATNPIGLPNRRGGVT